MSTQKIIYLLVGIVAGFMLGFGFANSVNRDEQDALRAEVRRLRTTSTPAAGATTGNTAAGSSDTRLSEEDLRRAIETGDAAPADIELQRNLGRGLYLYAVNSGNTPLLNDASRMLERAHKSDPKDYETTVLLGNVLFDIGQNSGDPSRLRAARGLYLKALKIKPDDINVRTDLGLTYYFDRPSDPQRAITEYRRSLAANPRHEMTLQNLAAALISTGNRDEAERRLEELEQVNASNASLPNLRAQLAQSRIAPPPPQSTPAGKERN